MDIAELRKKGYSYKKIADKLHISINTVKSYCRRNNLGGVRKKKIEDGVCPYCNKVLSHNIKYKKKRFCSDTCRQKWWNENLDRVNRKANYKFICKHCNKEFVSYGNKNRKYCSHECYIEDRFR